jgi:uncharacterized protein
MTDHQTLSAALAGIDDIRLAVVFGSVASRRACAGSDLDVGLLVAGGAEDVWPAAAEALRRASRRRIDLVDLRRAPPLLRFEVARSGTVLLERDPGAWVDFKARAMIDWWDWAPTARMIHAAAIARLRARPSHG